ncbi:MAG: ABC transporter substrate-binding protein [Firmicutes bacterium]|nr:ABC transporter substrate-binding protein [Bacillota bacterium]
MSNHSLGRTIRKNRWLALLLAMCMALAGLTGCGGSGSGGGTTAEDADGAAAAGPEIPGLTYESTLELDRATEYSVYRYEGGYDLIDIHDHQRFLLVPEGEIAPEGLEEDIIVLYKPIDRIYLAATATMAMFYSMNAQDHIRMSSIKKDAWTFDEPKADMEAGKIIYAGKYSAPDYETMLDEDCNLAIESTMIDHTPEVQEMIEDLGIPVLVDRSSYESDPMGRAEWIRLYGVLTDHEEEADAFFDEQMASIKELDDFQNTEKTVAFFYISSDGKVVVRRSTDYIPKMIEIAGARYIFKDLDDESGRTSIDMSIETFYDTAVDADYIIYNGSIDGSVKSLDDLKAKDPVMEKMAAVQNGNCWVTGSSMYQRTDIVADMILDFHKLFSEDEPTDLKYIQKLQ